MQNTMQVYPQGKMSQCMERLNMGDTLRFKGPRGKFKYSPNMKKAIGKPSMSASVSFAATICEWGSVRISIVWQQASRCDNRLTIRAASSPKVDSIKTTFSSMHQVQHPHAARLAVRCENKTQYRTEWRQPPHMTHSRQPCNCDLAFSRRCSRCLLLWPCRDDSGNLRYHAHVSGSAGCLEELLRRHRSSVWLCSSGKVLVMRCSTNCPSAILFLAMQA